MNCSGLISTLGFECEEVAAQDGGTVLCIDTPFRFFDDDSIAIYARQAGAHLHLFDEGESLAHVMSLGFSLRDRRRWTPFRHIATRFGVNLTDNGELEIWAREGQASSAFARMISVILGISEWERENIGLPADAHWLIQEAELYLRAWKPHVEIVRDVEMCGLSGKSHKFAFEFDGELFDAISPHPAAIGAELRKLVDVRNKPVSADARITVIVDDRRDAAKALQEIAIVGRLATAWPMSKLIGVAEKFDSGRPA